MTGYNCGFLLEVFFVCVDKLIFLSKKQNVEPSSMFGYEFVNGLHKRILLGLVRYNLKDL